MLSCSLACSVTVPHPRMLSFPSFPSLSLAFIVTRIFSRPSLVRVALPPSSASTVFGSATADWKQAKGESVAGPEQASSVRAVSVRVEVLSWPG